MLKVFTWTLLVMCLVSCGKGNNEADIARGKAEAMMEYLEDQNALNGLNFNEKESIKGHIENEFFDAIVKGKE